MDLLKLNRKLSALGHFKALATMESGGSVRVECENGLLDDRVVEVVLNYCKANRAFFIIRAKGSSARVYMQIDFYKD